MDLFWKCITLVLVILVVSISSCTISVNSNNTDSLEKLIISGVPAKEAGCSIAIANGGTVEAVRLYCLSK